MAGPIQGSTAWQSNAGHGAFPHEPEVKQAVRQRFERTCKGILASA
jgi:hypothetical protein